MYYIYIYIICNGCTNYIDSMKIMLIVNVFIIFKHGPSTIHLSSNIPS